MVQATRSGEFRSFQLWESANTTLGVSLLKVLRQRSNYDKRAGCAKRGLIDHEDWVTEDPPTLFTFKE